MKQKQDNRLPVTKKELTETLKYYPTKEELKEAENRLRAELRASEKQLEIKLDKKFVDRLTSSQAAFRVENDHRFSIMMEDIDAKFTKFANLILTAIDPLLKELETRQQDRELATAQFKRIEDDVDKLKKRDTKLEHS